MDRTGWVCLILVAWTACDSSSERPAAIDGGRSDPVPVLDAAADAAAPRCSEPRLPQYVGIASASLEATDLHFTPELELTGRGVDELFDAKQNGLMAWIPQRNKSRSITLAFGGFWDLQPDAPPRWFDTSRIMHSYATADVDRDGDLDVLLLSSGTEVSVEGGSPVVRFTSRIEVWERSPAGLAPRTELWRKTPGGVVGLPFAFTDLDGDGAVDVVGFVDREVIGYYGDGAFGFRREVLAGADVPDTYAALIVVLEDRDRDGREDLLAVLGSGGADVSFFNLVYLRDEAGRFMPHAPPAAFELSPSPIAAVDVTGDGLSDVVAQGFRDGQPILRLTASIDALRFAATSSIEPPSTGLKLGDVDGDGTIDVLTEIDGRLVAQLARAGSFERRDLGLTMTGNLLDLSVRPRGDGRPARLEVLYSVSCDPHCDEDCLDHCLEDGCVVCTMDDECASGMCRADSCASTVPRTF